VRNSSRSVVDDAAQVIGVYLHKAAKYCCGLPAVIYKMSFRLLSTRSALLIRSLVEEGSTSMTLMCRGNHVLETISNS